MKYRIFDKLSNDYFGIFDAESKDDAIDALRKAQGFESSEDFAKHHVAREGLGLEYLLPIQRMLDARLLVEEAKKETIQ
jgi:hypothetical protein